MVSAMRRVRVVVREGGVEEMRALVDLLPGIEAQVATSLEAGTWQDLDCVWLHDVSVSSPHMRSWLRAGGRLLATLSAVEVAVALGLESVPPDDVRDTLWEEGPDSPPRGLAGFGPHPLFDGLQFGCCTWTPEAGAPYRWSTYLERRPASARVVAVERVDLELNPSRLVAWEYDVGDGGLLCIGSGVHPGPAGQVCAPQLRALLRNALAGQGIPHRDRLVAAPSWPEPASRVVRQDLVPVPALPPLDEDWPAIPWPQAEHAVEGWRQSGRRAWLSGGAGPGLSEAWIHPFSILRDPVVSEGGRRPSAEGALTERWVAALEHPIVYWEIEGPAESPLSVEWTSDLRRAWPYPAGGGGDLELSIAPGGRRAVLRAVGDPFELIIDAEGGTLEAVPTEQAAVRFALRGTGRCRLRFTGAADGGDLERSREVLARRGLPGLLKQRGEHTRELATYATSIETPEPALDEAFEWAKRRLDGGLAGSPGVGRCLAVESVTADRPGGMRFVGPAGCIHAMAQLGAGDRDSPRDTLKFLSLTQAVDGRIVDTATTSGLVRHALTPAVPRYLLLASHYAAWSGELDFLARRWATIRRSYELGMAERPWTTDPGGAELWARALEGLLPLAEALGHPESAEELAVAAGAARAAVGIATFRGGSTPLVDFQEGRPQDGLEGWRRLSSDSLDGGGDAAHAAALAGLAIEGLWGIEPNALEGAVRFAPWFPAEWDAMAIERVRVGRTVLTVRMRRRFGQVAAKVERVHGPRMHVDFVLRGTPADAAVLVDDVELRGGRVAFEADGNHALVWHS